MSDLQAALQQVLRQVREGTGHIGLCKELRVTGAIQGGCECNLQERVEAEQARRWAAFADKLWSWNSQYMHCESQEEEKQVDIDAFASALKAAQQEER